MDEFHRILNGYTRDALDQVALRHGVAEPAQLARGRLIAVLIETLQQPERIAERVAALPAAVRPVLHALQQRGGAAQLSEIDAAFGYHTLQPEAREAAHTTLVMHLADLTLFGLVFSIGPDPLSPSQGLLPAERLVIPLVIRRHLSPPPPPEFVEPVVGHVVINDARLFQRDLYLYWSFVRDHGARLTAKGELYKRALAEVNRTLLTPEEIGKRAESKVPRLLFLRGLLHALRLVNLLSNNELQAAIQPPLFNKDLSERTQRSFAAYRSGRFTNELSWLPGFTQARGAEALPAPQLIVDARELVLGHIETLAGDRWISFDELAWRVRTSDYEFLFKRTIGNGQGNGTLRHSLNTYNPQSHVLGWGFPDVMAEAEGWNQVEHGFITNIVTGPLHWLGLVELGYRTGASANPIAFRLTDLGRWLFEDGPRPDYQTAGGRIIVQPNYHIVALDPVSEATLATLDQFAERLSAERAVEYRLTQQSVYHGQRRGWDADEITSFLQHQTDMPLPENIRRTLHEWQSKHERIIVHPHVNLIHASDTDDMDALLTAPAVAASRPRRLGPTVALLPVDTDLGELRQQLEADNWLPLLTRQADDLPASSLIADADGQIRVVTKTPSIYMHAHLAAIAAMDPADDHLYYVTPETVQRATAGGMNANQIIERLGGMHRGPLPDVLRRKIRAWARHYGDASIEVITLLQFKDEATLDELLRDREVAPLIDRFGPARGRALARVRTKDLGRLKKLLGERGIDISEQIT